MEHHLVAVKIIGAPKKARSGVLYYTTVVVGDSKQGAAKKKKDSNFKTHKLFFLSMWCRYTWYTYLKKYKHMNSLNLSLLNSIYYLVDKYGSTMNVQFTWYLLTYFVIFFLRCEIAQFLFLLVPILKLIKHLLKMHYKRTVN